MIVIKLGARAVISSKPTGKTKVTLSVAATSYSTSHEKFSGWNASTATIQDKAGLELGDAQDGQAQGWRALQDDQQGQEGL